MLSFSHTTPRKKWETSGTWVERTCHATSSPSWTPPLNPSALGHLFTLISANPPAHSKRLQPLPSFPSFPACYPQIPNHSSHIFFYFPPPLPSLPSILHHLHSIPNLTRNPNSCRLLSRSSVSLKLPPQSGPASSVPLAPTPLPTLSLPGGALAPRPPTAAARASLTADPSSRAAPGWPLLHSRPGADPEKGRGGTLRPPPLGPLPAPPQLPPPVMVSAAPAAAALAQVGRREERASPGAAQTVWEFPERQGGEGRWVGRSAGRRQRAGGSDNSGAPRQKPPRTAPAPANNRLRPQRSGSYRRRHVRTEPRGRLGNAVYVLALRPAACRELEAATCAEPKFAGKRTQEAAIPLQPGKASLTPLQPFEEDEGRPSAPDLRWLNKFSPKTLPFLSSGPHFQA